MGVWGLVLERLVLQKLPEHFPHSAPPLPVPSWDKLCGFWEGKDRFSAQERGALSLPFLGCPQLSGTYLRTTPVTQPFVGCGFLAIWGSPVLPVSTELLSVLGHDLDPDFPVCAASLG